MTPATSREHLVRALWTVFEPIHAVTYFSREAREEFASIGFPRYWDGYFAGRAAALGAVAAAPVIAIFGGFSPFLVERALPAAWEVAAPATVLDARLRGAARTLAALHPDSDRVHEAAMLLDRIARHADTAGRPLGAANQALAAESDPYRWLWQSTATLRELRGDGHIIAQVSEGIGGIQAVILRSATDTDPATMRRSRGWSEERWSAETDDLIERGLLSPGGRISPAGLEKLAEVEHLTNRLAVQPWEGLTDDELRRIAQVLRPIADACSGVFSYPNPIGIPRPWNPEEDPAAARIPEVPQPRP